MSYLHQVLELRSRIRQIEADLEKLMPYAVSEAVSLRDTEKAPNKKAIVYRHQRNKIVLSYRKRYNLENRVVMRLREDILAELKRLSRANREQLNFIEHSLEVLHQEIEKLEAQREALLTSPHLQQLKRHEAIALEESAQYQPRLSVYL